jgi:hypothetical protein
MSTASEGKRLLGLIRNPRGDSRQIDGGTLFMRQRTPSVGTDNIGTQQDSVKAKVIKTEKGV